MGLFDKKTCDFCGKKIGLLGNRKLEDGNMCKECASRLSPWFNERRHSGKEEIAAQLDYREENKKAVQAFQITRSIGKYNRLLLDENHRKLTVTNATDLNSANPDILDYSQITGCALGIDERRNELTQKNAEGKSVSYNPPRYEYSYNLKATIFVDNPFFDEMSYSISNGYINTGEQRMASEAAGGWNLTHTGQLDGLRIRDYRECVALGNEIKSVIDGICADNRIREQVHNAPKTAVKCPYCGATTIPDENGCCEYCGSALNK